MESFKQTTFTINTCKGNRYLHYLRIMEVFLLLRRSNYKGMLHALLLRDNFILPLFYNSVLTLWVRPKTLLVGCPKALTRSITSSSVLQITFGIGFVCTWSSLMCPEHRQPTKKNKTFTKQFYAVIYITFRFSLNELFKLNANFLVWYYFLLSSQVIYFALYIAWLPKNIIQTWGTFVSNFRRSITWVKNLQFLSAIVLVL